MATGSLMNVVQGFLTQDEWNFRQLEDRPVLQMGFRGKNGNWQCYAQVKEEQQRFIFYSVCETNIPEAKRVLAAEFLTRANYGLIVGNFELDFSDGEVRYKTSVDVEGGELTADMVKSLVYVNVLTFDRYLPGLMSVIYADITPAAAIEKIEAAG